GAGALPPCQLPASPQLVLPAPPCHVKVALAKATPAADRASATPTSTLAAIPRTRMGSGSQNLTLVGLSGSRRSARALGGRLGQPECLAGLRARDRDRDRPHVRARGGVDDVRRDALPGAGDAVELDHDRHLAERVLTLGDRPDRELAERRGAAGGLVDRLEGRVDRAVAGE